MHPRTSTAKSPWTQSEVPSVAPLKTSEQLSTGALLYAYAVFLGATYLFAFWRPFGFSVFPYLSIQDYISTPLNRVVVLLVAVPILPLPLVVQRLQFDAATIRAFVIGLFGGYTGLALYYFSDCAQLFFQHSFHYRNETTVLITIVTLMLSSCVIAFQARRSPQVVHSLVLSLALVQSSAVLAAGYKDGKTIYNGATEVHYLDTREVCEKEGTQPWVFVGRFSDVSIFMNAIDKRLCITGEKTYRLVPRKVFENL